MKTSEFILAIIAGMLLLGAIGAGCYAYPQYNVWQQGLAGEARLREATHSRQIAIEEAEARLASASFDADAEVVRAHGVAEANKIIGDSLKNNEAYLRYLWILGLNTGSSETIYIPTEANLPILEATRRTTPTKATGAPAGIAPGAQPPSVNEAGQEMRMPPQ